VDRSQVIDKPPSNLPHKAMVSLPRDTLRALTPPIFERESIAINKGKLKELGLDDNQANSISELVSAMLGQIAHEESQHSRVVTLGTDQFLEIDPFIDAGKKIKSDFEGKLRQILPDGRADCWSAAWQKISAPGVSVWNAGKFPSNPSPLAVRKYGDTR
jgi:hypothetical protein